MSVEYASARHARVTAGTILPVGDVSGAQQGAPTALGDFLDACRRRLPPGWQVRPVDYASVLDGKLPSVDGAVVAVLFFPYRYWDGEIEGRLPGPYGGLAYATALSGYLAACGDALVGTLPAVRFLNAPHAVARTRDKVATKEALVAHAVPTPAWHQALDPARLRELLDAGERLYVKARCGSMGKGLAVLERERWRTNFAVAGDRLTAPTAAAGGFEARERWPFREAEPWAQALVDAACSTDFLVESAPREPLVDGSRIEVRCTVVAGRLTRIDLLAAAAGAPTTRVVDGGRPVEADAGDVLPPGSRRALDAAAVAAADALELDYVVLDVVFDGDLDRPEVIDAQAFPALGADPAAYEELVTALVHDTRTVRGRTGGRHHHGYTEGNLS
jgi:hypothetical protein